MVPSEWGQRCIDTRLHNMRCRGTGAERLNRSPLPTRSARRYSRDLIDHQTLVSASRRIIPIRPIATAVPSAAAPRLSGPPQTVARVIARLAPRMEELFARSVATAEWLDSLDLVEGEAVLRLNRGLSVCQPTALQVAFETLRTLLPDTDIYITA